ncbi:MAG: hypothetical protein NTY64_22265 [Deltaproteobacteria bacterium]|nr:hypothetical protein [Deltaproteobacteria bacterium]
MKRFFLVVLVLTGLALCSCATMNPVIPLPNDILIVSPDPNLPPEIKAFSGKWGGRWWNPSGPSNHGLDAVLIVEEIINERQATVVFGWGNSFEWETKEGWSRFKANFSQNKKGITLSWIWARTKSEFRVKGDKLEGVVYGNYTNFVTMRRLQ